MDFVVYRPWGVVLLEVDEDQHKHYGVICDAARMMDLLAEQVKAGRQDKFKLIRFNPDGYTLGGKAQKTPQKERRATLLQELAREPASQFEIRYLYYDQATQLPDVCSDSDYPAELRELVVMPD